MPLNRPTQAELLQAVAEYLGNPADNSNMDAFLRKVAANVSQICIREMAQGAAYQAEDQAFTVGQMQALGERSLAGLCDQLAGGVDDDWLRVQLEQWLLLAGRKLDIDSPKYHR